MEGVIDFTMRELLTEVNDYDLCMTEFLRVVDQKVPKHKFYKLAPELYKGGLTASGTPIRIQLLGQDPQWLAENALIAHELGSHGVDINFGCPAPTVNKRKGGAALLKEPELIYRIISQVKEALKPTNQPLSVKIRLGFDDASLLDEIISAIDDAQPNLLTVHARTKKQGYKPPAYWEYIRYIAKRTSVELVANGEIWSAKDAQACINKSGTKNLMLGRGALALPNIANVIKHNEKSLEWDLVRHLIMRWLLKESPNQQHSYYHASRLKQWCKYLKRQYPEAELLFGQIIKLENRQDIISILMD